MANFEQLYFTLFNTCTNIERHLESWDITISKEFMLEIMKNSKRPDVCQETCKILCGAIHDALLDMDELNTDAAVERLKNAQRQTEEMFISSLDGDVILEDDQVIEKYMAIYGHCFTDEQIAQKYKELKAMIAEREKENDSSGEES